MAANLRAFYAFRLLVTAYLFVPAQVALLMARGLGFSEILLLNTVYNLVAVVFEVPTGALADRLGRRLAMALGALAMAAGAAAYVFAGSFVAFAAAESLFAIGMSLASGSDSAYLFDRLKSEGKSDDYPRAEGTASAYKHLGTVAAFAVGGTLAARSPALPYAITAVVSLLAAGVALRLPEAPATRRLDEARWGGFVPHMRDSVRVAWGLPRLRSAIFYSALVFVLLRISLYLYQPYLRTAGFDLAQTGVVLAAVYGVAAIASRQVGRDYAVLPSGTLVLGLPLVLGLSYLIMAGTHGAVAAVALLVLQATVNGAYSPVSKSLLNREIADSNLRATMLSVESLVRRLVFALFSGLLGVVIDKGGLPLGLVVCGLVGFCGASVIVVRSRAPRPRIALVGEAASATPPPKDRVRRSA